MKPCLEIVSYQLKQGVSEENFLKAANLLHEVLCKENGFIKREVFVNEKSGTWVEMAEWESFEAAKQCGAKIMKDPVMAEIMALIDASTIQMHLVRQVM